MMKIEGWEFNKMVKLSFIGVFIFDPTNIYMI